MKLFKLFKANAMDPLFRVLLDVKIRYILKKYDHYVHIYDPDKSITENLEGILFRWKHDAIWNSKDSARYRRYWLNLLSQRKTDKLWRVYQENRKKWEVRHTELQKCKTRIKKLELEIERLKNEKEVSSK